MEKVFFVLYVRDQEKSAAFYSAVLQQDPALHVPGMTKYVLSDGSSFGLMPAAGIKALLGDKLPDPTQAASIPRSELYLLVQDPQSYHQRALELGATEISALQERPWGDQAAYSLDADGHVLVFAQTKAS